MKNILIFTILIVAFSACQSKKKQAELLELSKPAWLKSRPVSSAFFYGIGIAPKIGGSQYYQSKVKDKALADLAQQINTRVKSETSFYKMEDNKGVYEYIQSRINATSNEFIEGYEFVDEWEDESQVYAFYRLSKQEFYRLKAERKDKAIELAWLKLNQAEEKVNSREYMEAIELYASCIDALSGYLNEEVSKEVNGQKTDLFESSKDGMTQLLEQCEIHCSQSTISGRQNQRIEQGFANVNISINAQPASGIPVKFVYSGGYITDDKNISDTEGMVNTPALPYNNKASEQLVAEIDFINLGRMASKNLFVRQLIEKQKKQSCIFKISFTN